MSYDNSVPHEDRQPPLEISAETNAVAGHIVDAAFTVHSRLGPGLLEAVYEVCLHHELTKRHLQVERQVPLSVTYDGLQFEVAYRLDLVVEGSVIIELKAVETVTAAHKAQLRTYLKLSGKRLGFLINFNAALVKWGITRIAL